MSPFIQYAFKGFTVYTSFRKLEMGHRVWMEMGHRVWMDMDSLRIVCFFDEKSIKDEVYHIQMYDVT